MFGAPTLRLKGDYLAIVTLGFGEIVPIVVRNWPSLTNGAMGLNGVAPPQLFGFDFGVSATPYYYVGVALVALLILMSLRLKDSRIGRAWMAIREDEIAAAAMGVNLVRMKLLAFATGAAFARRDRHALRRQIADRDAGHVHVSGIGHDPRHGRLRRDRQCLGRRRRRVVAADPAILVS